MPANDDDDDAEWTGRPQDDPRLTAMQDAARAEFRREHPPVDCWIDAVQTIELYQSGILRARVERGRASITFFDDKGDGVAVMIYLRSENPYDVAEEYLRIGRVAETRDESNEAEEPISSWPRDSEDRQAASFRERYIDREDEIFLYLRSAVSALRLEGKGNGAPDVKPLLDAITAAVMDEYEDALTHVRAAAASLEQREQAMMFARPALADCRRAIVAMERHVAIQRKRPLRRSRTDGKSGGWSNSSKSAKRFCVRNCGKTKSWSIR